MPEKFSDLKKIQFAATITNKTTIKGTEPRPQNVPLPISDQKTTSVFIPNLPPKTNQASLYQNCYKNNHLSSTINQPEYQRTTRNHSLIAKYQPNDAPKYHLRTRLPQKVELSRIKKDFFFVQLISQQKKVKFRLFCQKLLNSKLNNSSKQICLLNILEFATDKPVHLTVRVCHGLS